MVIWVVYVPFLLVGVMLQLAPFSRSHFQCDMYDKTGVQNGCSHNNTILTRKPFHPRVVARARSMRAGW